MLQKNSVQNIISMFNISTIRCTDMTVHIVQNDNAEISEAK